MRSKTVITCAFGEVTTCVLSSPIGNMVVRSCPNGLHSLGQVEGTTDDNFEPDLSRTVKWISAPEPGTAVQTPMQTCFDWLQRYFKDPSSVGDFAKPQLCLPPLQTAAFRERVWWTLADRVSAGQTVSYGELAVLTGSPRAARAVGSAMATNPFQLIVPCHRVTRSDSTLGMYAHGTLNSVKKWLLAHEGVHCD